MRDLEQESQKFLAPTTDKERAIIEAAVELLGERGIDGATTAEIAKRANVTERTLFRYFPSKRDLIKRVLFPLFLRGGLVRKWEAFEAMLNATGPDLRSWYVNFTTERLSAIAKNPGLARTLLSELVQNDELREAVGKLWEQHIWRPLVRGLEELQTKGAIRKEIDIKVLARAIHCLNVGYFFTRHVFAPQLKWDDASEIDKMAEILTNGSGTPARADAPRESAGPRSLQPAPA